MIHPHTQLRYISDDIGYGVFATQLIPAGTMTYVKDILEIEVTPEQFQHFENRVQDVIEKYSYIAERGVRIISWDHAKYVNHCCQCNTMSTGYGFEIAIRDIQPGEEITDEYGMFNLDYEMQLVCSKPGCRGRVTAHDLDLYTEQWDGKVKSALRQLYGVDQPLWSLLPEEIMRELEAFQHDESAYRSVHSLRYPFPEVAGNGMMKNGSR